MTSTVLMRRPSGSAAAADDVLGSHRAAARAAVHQLALAVAFLVAGARLGVLLLRGADRVVDLSIAEEALVAGRFLRTARRAPGPLADADVVRAEAALAVLRLAAGLAVRDRGLGALFLDAI